MGLGPRVGLRHKDLGGPGGFPNKTEPAGISWVALLVAGVCGNLNSNGITTRSYGTARCFPKLLSDEPIWVSGCFVMFKLCRQGYWDYDEVMTVEFQGSTYNILRNSHMPLWRTLAAKLEAKISHTMLLSYSPMPLTCLHALSTAQKWGFAKISGTILGVPKMRILVYCSPYWGPPL